MSGVRNIRFQQVAEMVGNIEDVEPLEFSQMSKRQKSTQLRGVNSSIDAILDKTVGPDKTEQGKFLIFQLIRLFPQTGWLSLISTSIDSFKNYGEMTKAQRKSLGRTVYPIFDKLLELFCGSSEMEVQRSFLNARFNSIHADSPTYKPLIPVSSWANVESMVSNLGQNSDSFAYKELTVRQKRRRKQRWKVMDTCIKVVSGSNDAKQHEALFFDRMREIHPKLKTNYFWKLLSSLIDDNLPSLEPFDSHNSRQRKNNRRKYQTVENLVSKLCGCGSKKTKSN